MKRVCKTVVDRGRAIGPARCADLASACSIDNALAMPSNPPSQQQLESLFDLSLDMLAIAADGYLVQVNPAWTSAMGWSAPELTTSRFLDFVHPEDLDSTKIALRDLIEGVATTTFRNRFRHRDGTYRLLHWSLHPADGVVYVGARDVSTSTDLRERVERSEGLATAILRTAIDPIIVIDPAGVIVEANDATSALFGYSLDQLVGQNVSMLMPEPYRSEHDGYIRRYLLEGDPRIIGIGREVAAQRADASTFPMALAVSELRTDSDHLFTGIIHDLTERNQQRDDLRAANALLESRVADRTSQLEHLLDEVQRSNRDLEQFAYIASHDLQAPLRNVRQGLELLDEHLEETIGSNFDEEAQELRDLIVTAVLRMEELIKGLLLYSQVQKSPIDARELTDLHSLVSDVVAMLAPEVSNVGGDISVSELPRLSINRVQFRQVFQNLIENSIRYRSHERPLQIEIGVGDSGPSEVVVQIRDNGTGIDEAHHKRIFELFRRGHSGYEGVGLGLAICQRIIEGHNGEMWVESSADNGASFFMRLPLADAK